MTTQILIGLATLALLIGIVGASEWSLSRQIDRIVRAVDRDGFYVAKHVEVLMQGRPDLYAVSYNHRIGVGRRPRALVRGMEALRRELEAGLS